MAVVHCPRCELIFATKNEVDWHLREDHHWSEVALPPEHSPAGAPGTAPAA